MNLQNPKFTLIAIATLFVVPLLMAVLMRSSLWNFEPSSYANRGELIEPPIALDVSALEVQHLSKPVDPLTARKWVMLYPMPAQCHSACMEDIARLRQIHIATGRKRDRVAIWLVSPENVPEQQLDQLLAVYAELGVFSDPLRSINPKLYVDGTPGGGQAFLLDPSANIILRYAAGFDPNDIDKDLHRLLTWSSTN